MNCSSNSVKIVLDHYSSKIASIYPKKEAFSITWILLEHFFDINRLMLAMNPEMRLSESELIILHEACKKVVQHVPVQYITNETEFFGLPFQLNSSTLIPRPETEELVQLILKELLDSPCQILDVGTGTGCIAIALKNNRSDCEISACDISEEALQVACYNADINKVEIHFFQCDVLSQEALQMISNVDVIVSNPPYLRYSEKETMRPNVLLYEPEKALFVSDDNPLIFYDAITKIAVKKLVAQGKIFFEINENFGNGVAKILKDNHFGQIRILKDFNGKDRFACAVKL